MPRQGPCWLPAAYARSERLTPGAENPPIERAIHSEHNRQDRNQITHYRILTKEQSAATARCVAKRYSGIDGAGDRIVARAQLRARLVPERKD